MAMGVPVLHGVEGESAEIVEDTGAGITFEPENADELTALLLKLKSDGQLLTDLQANCVRAAPAFGRTGLAGEMLAMLEAVVAESRSAARHQKYQGERRRREAELERKAP